MKKLKSTNGIPLSYIQSVLKIDPSSPSGLTWLPREDIRFIFENKPAGNKYTDKRGYTAWTSEITYNGKSYKVICSRIIFLLHYGYLTKGKCIDHIDNNSSNNNLKNLRESTNSQNSQNRKKQKNNTSGHKGIFWHKATGKWYVMITSNGKNNSFGLYEKLEEAIKVSIAARKKLHGTFGRIK